MNDLVISDELCRAIASFDGSVRFVTTQGEVLGRFEPELLPEEMAEIRRRLACGEPRYTTREVLDKLTAASEP